MVIESNHGIFSTSEFPQTNKTMSLEITEERVLEAAASCPDAKNVLTKLFPEVFEKKDDGPIELLTGCTLAEKGGLNLGMVGIGLAPIGLEYKCYVFHTNYIPDLMSYEGRHILIVRKVPI